MSYRDPVFYLLHAARDAGADSITLGVTAATGFPASRLVDDRSTADFKFSTDATGHTIVIDRGTGTVSGADHGIDTLIVPAGHGWDTGSNGDFIVEEADDVGMSVNLTTLLDVNDGPDEGAQVRETMTASQRRFVRLKWDGSGPDTQRMGELYLSRAVTLSRGPAPDWEQYLVSNFVESRMVSGERYRRKLGTRTKVHQLSWEFLTDADVAYLQTKLFDRLGDLVSPFYFLPPDDTITDALYVWVQEDPAIVQASPAPGGVGLRWNASLLLVECIQ